MAKSVFLFAGQGAQKIGMGKDLYEKYPCAKELFDHANDILDYSLTDVCWDGPEEKLHSTVVSQPALFTASLAAVEALRESNPDAESECVAAAGLSLGEYTALVYAGAMSFEDGLRVVKRRGEAMQAASDATASGMVAIQLLELAEVEELVEEAKSEGIIAVANHLSPGTIVVSGVLPACEKIEQLMEGRKGRAKRLTVAGAFHTEIMKPADEALAEALATVEIKSPRIPVWSNVDAKPHTDPEEIRSLLVQQVLSPVRWEDTMRGFLDEGCDRFYELGPGPVLCGLLKRVQRKVDCQHVPA